ncbi:MAG TPA: glycine oxidase ThiO [Gemmatales bacterium]|nr:glycine oxidase ThiO [Gemmatales bacterium]HMP58070.1 glycine oxidase ThiO [Gemmatales bacterium]
MNVVIEAKRARAVHYNTFMDVLVIGGGVIGLSCAFYLARAGARVALVDQGELGGEASWAGAGMITSQSTKRAHTPLGKLKTRSAALMPELSVTLKELTGLDNGYQRCGALELRSSVADLERRRQSRPGQECVEHAEQPAEEDGGLGGRVVGVAELRALEPALAPDLPGAIWYPEAAQVRNPWHVRALIAACQRLGVDLRSGCPVFAMTRRGERITDVATSTGRLQPGQVLVCTGAWSGGIGASLGLSWPVRPVRGQIVLMRAQPGLLQRMLLAGPRYLVPRLDGRVLVGSTEEDVGFDKSTTAVAQAELLQMALGYVPALGLFPVEKSWAGLRPASGDGKPILGPVPGFENLFVATGHFRSGLQLSPVTGMLMQQLLQGQTPELDLSPFRLDRF